MVSKVLEKGRKGGCKEKRLLLYRGVDFGLGKNNFIFIF